MDERDFAFEYLRFVFGRDPYWVSQADSEVCLNVTVQLATHMLENGYDKNKAEHYVREFVTWQQYDSVG